MKTTKIVWNGCDNHIESNESVFTRGEEFTPFEVIEVPLSEIKIDEDGDYEFDGIFVTEAGKFYRSVK